VWTEGGKGGQWELGKRAENGGSGLLAWSQQRWKFASSYKEPPFQVKGFLFIFHQAINIMYILAVLYCTSKNTFFSMQVKNKPRDRES
jgi:hypothetical protein